MELLNNFLNESAEYLWWVVVGNGGIGKSRLVLEWIRQLPSDWYGIFIDPDKCDKIPDFQLFNNTIFVFDYIVGNEKEIAYIIGELQRKHTGYKIRILFIERSLDNRMKNWLDHIKAALSSVDCIKFDQSSYSQPEIVPLMINSLKKAEGQEYTFDYLDKYLCECVEESIKNKYYFQRDKIAETISTSFCDDLPEKFWSPLYMSMYIELWVDHEGSPSIHTCEKLLEKYIEKEEAQWRKILGDDSLVYGYAKALTLACVLDGYCISIPYGYKNAEIGKLDQYIRDMRQPGGKKKDWSRIFIHEYEKAEYDLHKSKKAQKEMLMFFWKSVKQLLDRYPDNEKILISYIILLCDRILACNYNYSIFSEEDWNLFEKLSLQRPDLVELMVFYRMGLEYRIEHTNSKDKKWKDFQEKYFKFLLRMCETFQELEKDKNFTFPRTYPLEPSSNNVGNMFSSLLSIWKEDYTKTELELPHYDPDVKN